MVTIWTLYAHIVTTPAGIFSIRAGLFFTVGPHDRRRSSVLGRLFYCYNVCYTFSTACHSPPNFVEKFENFTLINEQKKVAFQQS